VAKPEHFLFPYHGIVQIGSAISLLISKLRLEYAMRSVVVKIDPDILGGTPCFTGTRVPVKARFDYLEDGDSLDAFLDDFPSVRHEQAVALLEESRPALLAA
jgi:uncharacterized protein (DUF433 family)